MSKLREEIKYVQNKVREQISTLEMTRGGTNFNETIGLCLNKNFKQLYEAIERGTNHFDEIDESPWRDCGNLQRAA
jgi:hypothetical protein